MSHPIDTVGKSSSRLLRKLGLLLAFVWGVAETLSGCQQSHSETWKETAPVVRTMKVMEVTSGRVSYTGTVHARIESDLGFRVPGEISARLVDPGQWVHKGQALMRLDGENLRLAAAASGQRLKAAEADSVRAAADEERLRGLVEAGAVSSAVYDAALAQAHAAAANVEAARSGDHDAALNFSYSTLKADVEGIVLDVVAQPGQVIAAGATVLRLGRAGPREAVIAVPEAAISTLTEHAAATLYGATRVINAQLREVAGAADPVTRTFAARYSLQTPDRDVPLGATVSLTLDTFRDSVIRVPLAAVYDPGSGPGVWVVKTDGRVEFRAVHVVSLAEESADIAAGAVDPGERIISLGASLIRAGQRVTIERQPS